MMKRVFHRYKRSRQKMSPLAIYALARIWGVSKKKAAKRVRKIIRSQS